jgi:pimeloyl-ACP methyl ester carboxylesterase
VTVSATDEQQEARGGVVTSYKNAPTRTITAGGTTYAYRELGPKGGIPVVFFVHLAATLDNWDPRIIDPIAKNHHVIAFDNRGVGASTGQVPDTVEAWPTTPTPSSRGSGSARSTSSPSRSAASWPRHSS